VTLQLLPICQLGIEACNWNWTFACPLAMQFCQATQFAPILVSAGNINVYDIRKPCDFPLCYDFSKLDDYLNLPSTREQLGVGDRTCAAK
jgi:serine carboxypeptidase-like clade IV